MRFSWKLGRIAGIDLFLHPTFFLILLLPGVRDSGALLITLAAFGCVVLHELGHALMARRYGIETADITIYPIGGVARLERMPKAAGPELLIALAGPAVNVAIACAIFAGLVAGLFSTGSVASVFAMNLLLVNIVLAGFNLIPAFPMDGGRVLRALLTGWLGRLRATTIAAGLGRFLAVLFGTYSLVNGLGFQVVLSVFIYIAAGAELARVQQEEDHGEQGGGRFDGDGRGIWTSPPGYHWVNRGDGVWQLSPIYVDGSRGGNRRWR